MHFPQTSSRAIRANWQLLVRRAGVLLLVLLMCSTGSFAYSVLTHEEIVDLLWASEIRPLLLTRFPGLTEAQITEAHGYAYGGAVIQDLGYYPFGSAEFSNLVHYVRTGDFVRELLRQSQDVNEYAFAIGALSHYTSDIVGHPAVNQAVAIEFPKLLAKYGKSVRYAEAKTAHLKTEFGFDTVQVAKNRYASQQYHDFIGFQVSKPLLERVFPIVYGVELKDVLTHEDLAIGSYRYSVGSLIPHMTQVALQTHKKELFHETPNFAKKKFLYRLSRSEYEKEWGKDYVKAGVGTRILSTLLRYMPKVGPFKGMAFQNPTAQTEDMYFKSINATVDQYRVFLEQVRTKTLVLPNDDLDTGAVSKAAEYSLTDDAYAKLLSRLSDSHFDKTSTALRTNILDFYSNTDLPIETKKDDGHWRGLLINLEELKQVTTVSAAKLRLEANAVGIPKAEVVPAVDPALPPAIVIGFVGGFIKHDDLVHAEVQLAATLRKAYPTGVDVSTYENRRGESARKRILDLLDTNHDKSLSKAEKQNARIIIYGHSWGGAESIELARELQQVGVPVLLTIQVDSVTKIHQDDSVIPANVARAVNFYQTSGHLHGQTTIRAADEKSTHIIGNFRFNYDPAAYACTKYPWYDRVFSKGHTQIECDPSVWKQAEALIRADLPKVVEAPAPL